MWDTSDYVRFCTDGSDAWGFFANFPSCCQNQRNNLCYCPTTKIMHAGMEFHASKVTFRLTMAPNWTSLAIANS